MYKKIDFENYSCYDKIKKIREIQSQEYYLKCVNNNIFTFEYSKLFCENIKIDHSENIITLIKQSNTQLYIYYDFTQFDIDLIKPFKDYLLIPLNKQSVTPSVFFQIGSLTDLIKKRLKFISQHRNILNSIFSLDYHSYYSPEINIRRFYSLRKYIDVFDKIKNKVNTKKLLELLILFNKKYLMAIKIGNELLVIKNLPYGVSLEFVGIKIFIILKNVECDHIYYPFLKYLSNFLHKTNLIKELETKI